MYYNVSLNFFKTEIYRNLVHCGSHPDSCCTVLKVKL